MLYPANIQKIFAIKKRRYPQNHPFFFTKNWVFFSPKTYRLDCFTLVLDLLGQFIAPFGPFLILFDGKHYFKPLHMKFSGVRALV